MTYIYVVAVTGKVKVIRLCLKVERFNMFWMSMLEADDVQHGHHLSLISTNLYHYSLKVLNFSHENLHASAHLTSFCVKCWKNDKMSETAPPI